MCPKKMKDFFKDIIPLRRKHRIISFLKGKVKNNNKLTKNSFVEQVLAHEQSVSEFQLQRDEKLAEKTNINTLSRKTKRKFIPERRIDLHGLTKEQALMTLARLLPLFQQENVKNVIIITGGSSVRAGKIRSSLHKWIEEDLSNYVSSLSQAKISDGGEGAFYITLRNTKK